MIKPSDLIKVAIIWVLALAATNFLQQYLGPMDWVKAADRSVSQVVAVSIVVGWAVGWRKT